MGVAHLVTEGRVEARELEQKRLRLAHRLAAAVTTMEATVGTPVVSAAQLGLFPGHELELRTEPRRACVDGECVELNPRERCYGDDCSRIELAPLDANVATPGLDPCEAEVIAALDVEACLARVCTTTRPTSFETVVDAPVRALISGVRKKCLARPRTTDGTLVLHYGWGREVIEGGEVYAGVTVYSPGAAAPSTVLCGGCTGVLHRLNGGWRNRASDQRNFTPLSSSERAHKPLPCSRSFIEGQVGSLIAPLALGP